MDQGYGKLASEVYDRAYPPGMSLDGDVEAYLSALSGVAGPVLEPAVGGGRFLIPLVEAGYTVTGYDLSPDMVAICRGRLAERGLFSRVVDGDMTNWVEQQAFAAVVVPTGSLVLLDGPAPTKAALESFAACLRPAGLLVFDIPVVSLTDEPDPLRVWQDDHAVWTLQTMGVTTDPERRQITRWLRYERWVDGALDATELMPFRLQQWRETEICELVRSAGLEAVVVTGDHGTGPSGPGSAVFTVTCRRPG